MHEVYYGTKLAKYDLPAMKIIFSFNRADLNSSIFSHISDDKNIYRVNLKVRNQMWAYIKIIGEDDAGIDTVEVIDQLRSTQAARNSKEEKIEDFLLERIPTIRTMKVTKMPTRLTLSGKDVKLVCKRHQKYFYPLTTYH